VVVPFIPRIDNKYVRQPWPSSVTWRHRTRHSIRHRPFPIGGPLEPSLYLYRFFGDIWP